MARWSTDGRATLARAGERALRARERFGVHARLAALEAEVQESRQLSRRVAELTDLVAELVVPLAQRDDEEVGVLLQRYRDSI